MPVFNIKQTNFHIVRMGGGQQTTSLELADEQGREWTLRSVDKKVRPPKEFMENTFMERIIQDHVSGAYPYAGLSVPDIAHAAGVPAGEQRLFFVPDDPVFGEYRSVMANRAFILVHHQLQQQKEITTEEMIAKLKSPDTPANATMGPTGWHRSVNEVTTPKLPPPPRTAQNRSGCSVSFATRTCPSAVTTSTETMLSMQ